MSSGVGTHSKQSMATIVMSVDEEATIFVEQCRPVDIQAEVVPLPVVTEMV